MSKESQNKINSIRKIAGNHLAKGIRWTRQLEYHIAMLIFRFAVFGICLGVYIYDRSLFEYFMNTPFWHDFSLIHVVWVIFMVIMISHLIPKNNRISMAVQKAKESMYRPANDHSELQLLKTVKDLNSKAWKVMLVWLSFNAIFGLLYLFGILNSSDLLMLTIFYFLSDYICIMLFCPFQTFIMKNKCCINCRIFDWGHFMMFTPMLFIRNFYSWSLFFTSLIVLIHWEIVYSNHPERFWEGSNLTLRCENCKEQTCAIKKRKKIVR